MKANEAPEKLYIDFRDKAESTWRCAYTDKVKANDIEYTRTDAFIEKAKKWFEEYFGNRLKWEITTYEFEDMQSMVEDFRKYMKGE